MIAFDLSAKAQHSKAPFSISTRHTRLPAHKDVLPTMLRRQPTEALLQPFQGSTQAQQMTPKHMQLLNQPVKDGPLPCCVLQSWQQGASFNRLASDSLVGLGM